MKNKTIIYILALFVLLSLLVLIMIKKERDISLEVTKIEKCDRRLKLYYSDDNNKIFTYCLEGVKVVEGNEAIELKDYFNQKNITDDDFFDLLTSIENLWKPSDLQISDGGSKLYLNDNFNLVRCHSITGEKQFNTDIYIGPNDMIFKNNFCKDENTTYIKTYKVLKIAQGANEFDKLLTLENNKGVKTTVLYETSIDEIEENKTYEFEFMLYTKNIEDKTKSIFDNSLIISIVETDKIGEAQINDSLK